MIARLHVAALILLSVSLSCLASGALAQQNGQSSVTGEVHDGSDAALAGTDVLIQAVSGSWQTTAITDSHGAFSVSGLVPGQYEVMITHPGFRKDTRIVTLPAGAQQALTFSLGLSGVTRRMVAAALLF